MMTSSYTIFLAFVYLAIMVVVGAGWIVPLVVGIVLWVQKKRFGRLLTLLGWCWLVALCVLAFWFAWSIQKEIRPPEEFRLADYKGSTGRLIIPHKGKATLTAYEGNKRGLYRTSNGEFVMPVGKYNQYYSFDILKLDDKGTTWSALVSLDGSASGKEIIISESKPCDVQIGPPFEASLMPTITDRKFTLSLEIKDAEGNNVRVSSFGNNDVARYELLDKSGKVLLSDKMEFG